MEKKKTTKQDEAGMKTEFTDEEWENYKIIQAVKIKAGAEEDGVKQE